MPQPLPSIAIREKGSDRWVDPNRDIAHVFPTAVVVGAAMALDPVTDANAYLRNTLPNADHEALVRAALKYLLRVLEDVRAEHIEEVWDGSQISQAVCTAIMAGVGGWLLHRYANEMYRGRLVGPDGGKNDPAPYVNRDAVWGMFDDCLRQIRERGLRAANG